MRGYCFLSAVPLRSTPSDRAEMVNQLLAGEVVELLEIQPKWTLVRAEYDGYTGWIDNKQYIPFDSAADLAERLFLGTPYLWGGRWLGGIDCSGLTQVCFKALGVWLPRDASMQVTAGYEVCLCDIQRDDLCFFHNQEGKVIHVGICTGDGYVVHASGMVRRDQLTPKGILVESTQQLSHQLYSVRRVV